MMEAAAGSLVQRLRVAIAAHASERIESLARLLRSLGHEVVGIGEHPEVILADRHRPMEERYPAVVLGGTDPEAQGLLPDDAGAAEIDAALRAVARGLVVRPTRMRVSGFGAAPDAEARMLLTPREAQVLDAIADGLTNKAIARRLGISLHTVKFHVESLFHKLGARTRTEAVARANERRREETIQL